MLRINLLPSYVAQRRITRQVWIIAYVLFFLSVAVPTYMYKQADRDQQDMDAKATQAEAQQKITQGYVTDATTRRSQIAPLKAKVDFVNQVYAYNLSQVKFYQTVAQYTDPKIIYTDATVAGTVLTIKAFCPSLADVGRYLQAIYNEPDFQTVAIDKLPGYPEATVTRYYLYGKLVGVGSSPANTTPGTAGTPASSAQNAPAPAGVTGTTGKAAYGQTLVSSALATAKDVPQNILDVLKSRISPFATPEQQARLYQDALTQLTSKTTPKGFDITVTATLKQVMTPPVVPGGSGVAASGPGGPPGGPPGGFPGGPPPGFVPPGGPPPGR